MSVVMPAMTGPQETAWHALMDLQVVHPTGWTLVGGQMVHLHCAERGASPTRPTDDVDAVLDVRAEPQVLHGFTTALTKLGFEPAGETWTGHQHRWERGDATVDILIPRHLGERAASRKGAGDGDADVLCSVQGLLGSGSLDGGSAARTCSALWSARRQRTPCRWMVTATVTSRTSWSLPA